MSENINELPAYSKAALAAMQLLYQSLQDVDIYVEDSSRKEVYNELIHGFDIEDIRFFSVIPLGKRDNLLNHAASNNKERPSCYFIDGDLPYAIEAQVFQDNRIYAHDRYCFENYLFNRRACCNIVLEQWGNINYDEAEKKVQWDTFSGEIEATLVPLFIVYAAAHRLDPSIKTVKCGLGAVTVEERGLSLLCKEKVDAEIRRVDEALRQSIDPRNLTATILEINERVYSLEDTTSIVSGKDYLLPLLIQHIHSVCKPKMTRESLVMRLMRNCEKKVFSATQEFIKKQIGI